MRTLPLFPFSTVVFTSTTFGEPAGLFGETTGFFTEPVFSSAPLPPEWLPALSLALLPRPPAAVEDPELPDEDVEFGEIIPDDEEANA